MNGIENEFATILKNREIASLKKQLENAKQIIEVYEKKLNDIHEILIR